MADEVPNTTGASSPPPTFGETKPAAAPQPDPSTQAVTTNPAEVKPSNEKPAETSTPPAEAPKEPERIVPEKYDLKLPDDTVLDQRSLERLESYAKTNKLTQDEARDLVTRNDQDVRSALEERKAYWLNETKNDREIGGDNLNQNVETANRFLDKHMAPELRQELNRTGYGNNRHFMKFVLDMAKRSQNDTAVIPGSHAAPIERSTADMLYGNSTSKR